jgi:hypothetical protein
MRDEEKIMGSTQQHARSSVAMWGGVIPDYLPLHEWLDETRFAFPDVRHHALRHHVEGIDLCERVFGYYIIRTDGKTIPTRWIAERHIREDFGRIPIAADYLRHLIVQSWMFGYATPEEEPDDGGETAE